MTGKALGGNKTALLQRICNAAASPLNAHGAALAALKLSNDLPAGAGPWLRKCVKAWGLTGPFNTSVGIHPLRFSKCSCTFLTTLGTFVQPLHSLTACEKLCCLCSWKMGTGRTISKSVRPWTIATGRPARQLLIRRMRMMQIDGRKTFLFLPWESFAAMPTPTHLQQSLLAFRNTLSTGSLPVCEVARVWHTRLSCRRQSRDPSTS